MKFTKTEAGKYNTRILDTVIAIENTGERTGTGRVIWSAELKNLKGETLVYTTTDMQGEDIDTMKKAKAVGVSLHIKYS